MKYIDRSKVAAPANLQGQTAPSSGNDIQKSIYAHADVKEALNDLQRGICCYCETHYKATCPGDVEHFRPKGGYQQDKSDDFHQPGYYWLAYKWENLLYACENCNRYNKQNYFPLKDPTKRFDPAVKDISQEEPLLINPYEEQHPENHLTFVGTAIKALTDRGDASITYYGLARKELDESRRETWNDLNSYVDLVTIAQTMGATDDAVSVMEARVKQRIKEKIDAGQHTLMIRCIFKKYL